ncbi:MAG: shikimate kinase [Rubrobacteraceae bacterium]
MYGPVAIVGYMGSGKSSVGRLLARRLGWEFADLDREIERKERRTIPEIFAESGEEAFRNLEHKSLLNVLDGADERVVACGGGTVTHPGSRKVLRDVGTVFLEEDTGVLFGRTRGSRRPLRAGTPEEFGRRYSERIGHYREVADLTIIMRNRPKDQVVEEIIRWLNG